MKDFQGTHRFLKRRKASKTEYKYSIRNNQDCNYGLL
jgi:hypothetical protein